MGSLFVADLGDVRLPQKLEHEVAERIRSTVKRALASVDFKGDVSDRPTVSDLKIKWPDHTIGIWIPPDQR